MTVFSDGLSLKSSFVCVILQIVTVVFSYSSEKCQNQKKLFVTEIYRNIIEDVTSASSKVVIQVVLSLLFTASFEEHSQCTFRSVFNAFDYGLW